MDYIPPVLLPALAGWHEHRFYRWVNSIAAARARSRDQQGEECFYEDCPGVGLLCLMNAVCDFLLVVLIPSRGSWSTVAFYSVVGFSAFAGWSLRLFLEGLRGPDTPPG